MLYTKDKDMPNPSKPKKPSKPDNIQELQVAQSPGTTYTIKEVADRLNVTAATLKKWEKQGKIPKAKRNHFKWRTYTAEEVEGIISIVRKNDFFVNSNNNN